MPGAEAGESLEALAAATPGTRAAADRAAAAAADPAPMSASRHAVAQLFATEAGQGGDRDVPG